MLQPMQAEADVLTLLVADNKAGYFGVSLDKRGRIRPYLAQVRRGGKQVTLGMFATAEEAALCVARSPEGQEAAKKAAAAPPLTSEEADVVEVEVEVEVAVMAGGGGVPAGCRPPRREGQRGSGASTGPSPSSSPSA